MSTNIVTVKVAGKTYTLRSLDAPEYLQKVAEIVDRRIKEISFSTQLKDREAIAVSAALSFVDELTRAKEENARLQRRMRTPKTDENP